MLKDKIKKNQLKKQKKNFKSTAQNHDLSHDTRITLHN
jgi:hypothetical protein